MKELFAKRLKNARKLAGMSQDDLVSAMDGFVKKTSIAKYERAEMMPDSEGIRVLSKALGVLPAYFLREFHVTIQKLEFRKKKKLGIKELESIQQNVMSKLESYLELEELTGSNLPFERPLTDFLIHTDEDVETAAEELIRVWNLGFKGMYPVFNILEDHGLRLIEIDADAAFDGVSTYANNQIPVIVLNKSFSVDRKRLTVLHELGHLLLNFSKEIRADLKRIERLCYRFGAALLMPRSLFFKEIGKNRHRLLLQELILLKKRYGLSVQAAVRRAKDLEVINEYHYTEWQRKFSRNKKEEGWGPYELDEQPMRFEQLLMRSVAEQVISVEKASELCGLKSFEFTEKYQMNDE